MSTNDDKENNENNSMCKLDNIKSKLILRKIFDILCREDLLRIVKYNKKIQNKLNLKIKDFEEGLKYYSLIEFELKIKKDEFGKFINVLNEKDKHFYHIYFNDDRIETKRRYVKKNEKIDKIKIVLGYGVLTFEKLFQECRCIESIHFKKFHRINISNMEYMFSRCSSLKEINFEKFITENVANMDSMFSGCSSLEKLNLSNFNTNNVTSMIFMFSGCSSLNELNLSNFNTSNVTNMIFMFSDCSSLKELDVSNFNINKVNDMSLMFSGCFSLETLKLFNCNNYNKANMKYLFNGCSYVLKNEIKSKNYFIKREAYMDDGFVSNKINF